MKLSAKKDGNGYIGSYTVNIGSAEARQCGLIDENGISYEIEKTLDPKNNTIIIKLKTS